MEVQMPSSPTPRPPSSYSSEHPSASAMDGDESVSSSLAKIDDEIGIGMDWEALALLNGRTDFIILHDIAGCLRCWSLTSYYKIMSKDDELLMNGIRSFSLPGAKPRNIYVSDLSQSCAFYVKFITCGCFPVVKRIEVRDSYRKRIGVISQTSKVMSSASFRIKNEIEGVSFSVKTKINFLKGHDYEILGSDDSSTVATIDRRGPAYSLNINESSIVTCSNKALFISLCLFLVCKIWCWWLS